MNVFYPYDKNDIFCIVEDTQSLETSNEERMMQINDTADIPDGNIPDIQVQRETIEAQHNIIEIQPETLEIQNNSVEVSHQAIKIGVQSKSRE